MAINDFFQMYLSELQEARSAEKQMEAALEAFGGMAQDPKLVSAISAHQTETAAQRQAIDGLLAQHGADPEAHVDTSMEHIVKEAGKWTGMIDDPGLRDAGLISTLQRMEHYELAALGTLTAWARQLGLEADSRVLEPRLERHKRFDAELSGLAEGSVNTGAMA